MEKNFLNKGLVAPSLIGAGIGLGFAFLTKKSNKAKILYTVLGATFAVIGYEIGEFTQKQK